MLAVNLLSNWVYLIGFEMAIVLLIASVIFLIHIRSLRRLIKALEDKVLAQRESLRAARTDRDALRVLLEDNQSGSVSYADALQEQLDTTRNRHLSLSPDRDIVLDIASDAPIERQALALRHAFLIAERESVLAADGEGTDWGILVAKLSQIIQFYQQPPEALAAADVLDEFEVESGPSGLEEEIEQQKRHIANLEKFRHLYFDVERKWREARAEAQGYHQELLAMGKSMGGGVEFDTLMQQYSDAYGGLGELLEGGGAAADDSSGGERISVGKTVIENQEEVLRLRNMAVDQHKLIQELKRKLSDTDSLDQQEHLIEEMHAQLERNQRFLKESDACIQQLEAEVGGLQAENAKLKNRSQAAAPASAASAATKEMEEEMELLRDLVTSFTEQSRDMLGTISVLEEDNRRLMAQGNSGNSEGGNSQGGNNDEEVKVLTGKLAQAQQELLNLKAQHVELEERYLELKMQAG